MGRVSWVVMFYCPEGGGRAAGRVQGEVAAARLCGHYADSGVKGGESHEADPVCGGCLLSSFWSVCCCWGDGINACAVFVTVGMHMLMASFLGVCIWFCLL